jgi:hypothetical protein
VSLIENVAAAAARLSLCILLPQDLTQQTLIPFAGFLLEYLVVYVPVTAQQTMFLNGITLDIYECVATIERDNWRRHSLMKFSCPQLLRLSEPTLSPERTISRLEDLFVHERVRKVQGLILKVEHRTETPDRVAL